MDYRITLTLIAFAMLLGLAIGDARGTRLGYERGVDALKKTCEAQVKLERLAGRVSACKDMADMLNHDKELAIDCVLKDDEVYFVSPNFENKILKMNGEQAN